MQKTTIQKRLILYIEAVSKNGEKTVFFTIYNFLAVIVHPKSRITFYPDNGDASKRNHRSRSSAEYRNITQAQLMAFVAHIQNISMLYYTTHPVNGIEFIKGKN